MKRIVAIIFWLIVGAGADRLIMRFLGSESLSRDQALTKDEFAKHLLLNDGGGRMAAMEALQTIIRSGPMDMENQKGRWKTLLTMEIVPFYIALAHAERHNYLEPGQLRTLQFQAGKMARLARDVGGVVDLPPPSAEIAEQIKAALPELPSNQHPLFMPPLMSDPERIRAFVEKYQSFGS